MGYRPRPADYSRPSTPPPPPPGRTGLNARSRDALMAVHGVTPPEPPDPWRDPAPQRKYQPPHWPFASLGAVVGGILGGALGETVGALSNNPSPFLTVPCVLLSGAAVGLAAWGKRSEAVVEPEPPEPEEPVDMCDHVGTADFEAVPVEVRVDEDGDAEPDIVAWLCSQCGAKVSKPRPSLAAKDREIARLSDPQPDIDILDVDALKVLLRDKVKGFEALVKSFDSDGYNFIVSEADVRDVEHRRNEIEKIKNLIVKRSSAVRTYYQPDQPTDVDEGDLWFDTGGDSTPYRWDGATWQEVETTEVYTHGSNFPTRRILS